jgi:response regulator of citrate/malate metabolism
MNNIRPECVDETKGFLRDLLCRLQQEKDEISAKIQRVEQNLAAFGGESPLAKGPKRRRRPRGVNRDSVVSVLAEKPETAFSVPNLAERIDIPRSSVRAALKKLAEEGAAEESSKGLWKYKEAIT